jgi:hypothetical protein
VTEVTRRVAKDLKTKLTVIPGGDTSQLQPLEVSFNKPFKAVVFKLFYSRTPRYNLSSTLYPQRCCYIMQVIHIV